MAVTYIEYGKKRYVPAQCPMCGEKRRELSEAKDLADLFKINCSAWRPTLRKNHWGIWRWFGYCGMCGLKDQIYDEGTVLFRAFKKLTGIV